MSESPHSTREWLGALVVVGGVVAAIVALLWLGLTLLFPPSVG
jgi:hypothetical protein